ncbi:outer membrane lipoprotein carrier protein LolA, partial [Francisella tularensis subsp. holarctica]|nr:outer membrane lipoprotein carrier protein LolA [Francisella tularensis subsp. holarctica]
MKMIIICFIFVFSINVSFADSTSELIDNIKNIHSM